MPIRLKVTLAILLALFLTALVGPLLIPINELEDTVSAQELADDRSQFIDLNGLNVHYQEHGSGQPTFVLLHGFGGNLTSWHELIEPLADIGRVVAFDRPGFGLTERPLADEWSSNPYTPEAQIELTGALIDALELPRPVLVGHSAGATVALQAALRYPEKIDALVLIAPAVYSGGGAPNWIRPLLQLPQANRLGPLLMRQFADEPGLNFLRASWHDESRIDDDVIARYQRSFRVHDWDKALWELTKASRTPALENQLAQLERPALILTGSEDALVPPEESRRLADELPNAQFAEVGSCGHIPHEECPERTLEALQGFFSESGIGLPSE